MENRYFFIRLFALNVIPCLIEPFVSDIEPANDNMKEVPIQLEYNEEGNVNFTSCLLNILNYLTQTL